MLADFRFLLRNRKRLRTLDRDTLKTIAKRIHTLPRLFALFWRTSRLRRSGATIGFCSIVSRSRLQGRIRNLVIGDFSVIGQVSLQLHGTIRIGRCVAVNDGVRMTTGSHGIRDPYWAMFARDIVIEDYAWICTDASILPGVTIGRGAVVGAGAVVREDVPAYAVVVGNPAQLTASRRTEDLRYLPPQFFASVQAWLGKEPLPPEIFSLQSPLEH